MNIFISHAHTERELAEAWRELLTGILPGVQVFYSSQTDPQGGIGAGRWRDVVLQSVAKRRSDPRLVNAAVG